MGFSLTKKPLAWITDSTAYISDKLQGHPDLFSVPLNIHFDDIQYADAIDLTSEELYDKIKMREFPKPHNHLRMFVCMKKFPRTMKKRLLFIYHQK